MPHLLEKHFGAIGARLTLTHKRLSRAYDLDVRRDARGEYFALTLARDTDPTTFRVLQANRLARHLLLHHADGERFLCGHDERHWFAAAIADRVTTITDARRSLLPPALRHLKLSATELARHRNAAYQRQGEFFFVPVQRPELDLLPILHGEPLRRGTRNKPHVPSELVRFGGQPVVLCGGREYSDAEWKRATERDPGLRTRRWERRIKDAEVYVRGKVRHADHATITLDGWHRLYLNGELISASLSFYD